jgi:hypothetical protein
VLELGVVVVVLALVGIGAALALALSGLTQIKQLRTELDETQRQLNELKAAAEVFPVPPPPLPRTQKPRSGSLDDLREQLRQAHRDPSQESSEE